jgi:hypothetical protein
MELYIITGVVIILFTLLIMKYYREKYLEEKNEFHNELVNIDAYFYSDRYASESTRRKIWLHIPFEKNSRNWTNFGSRTSTDLNLAYMMLCIKSIIDYCGSTYDIIIIDDTNFTDLLKDDIDMLKLSGSLKDKYRELCLMKILYKYGGIIVPPSLFLCKNIKEIDDPKVWYVAEITNVQNVSYEQMYPSIMFSGSPAKNNQLNEYIQYYSKEIENDFGEHSLHFSNNYMRKNNINKLDGKCIGVKDKFNKPITLEDLMEDKKIELDEHHVGVYIPHNELIKRTKYNWYCALNAKQVLKCKIFISRYMVSTQK